MVKIDGDGLKKQLEKIEVDGYQVEVGKVDYRELPDQLENEALMSKLNPKDDPLESATIFEMDLIPEGDEEEEPASAFVVVFPGSIGLACPSLGDKSIFTNLSRTVNDLADQYKIKANVVVLK